MLGKLAGMALSYIDVGDVVTATEVVAGKNVDQCGQQGPWSVLNEWL